MSKTTQCFKIFEITGIVTNVDISVVGGCNIHNAVSNYMNTKLQQLPNQSEPYRQRNFQVVYGYEQLDELHSQLFLPGAKDQPDFGDKFDRYYHMAFLTAESQGRKLLGKEFSEAAFAGAPPSMSIHVTIALST